MSSEFNYKKFKEDIISATEKAFLEIIEEYEDQVYGFTLSCDSAVTSIGVVANTKEALEEQIEDEEDKYYYKFCEQEWEIWGAGDDEFQEIRNTLVEFRENNEDKISDPETYIYTDLFNEHRDKIIDTCLEALLEIKKEHFLGFCRLARRHSPYMTPSTSPRLGSRALIGVVPRVLPLIFSTS